MQFADCPKTSDVIVARDKRPGKAGDYSLEFTATRHGQQFAARLHLTTSILV
jgi:hypothetical protein